MGDDYPVVEAEPIDYSYYHDKDLWLYPKYKNYWDSAITKDISKAFFNFLDIEDEHRLPNRTYMFLHETLNKYLDILNKDYNPIKIIDKLVKRKEIKQIIIELERLKSILELDEHTPIPEILKTERGKLKRIEDLLYSSTERTETGIPIAEQLLLMVEKNIKEKKEKLKELKK